MNFKLFTLITLALAASLIAVARAEEQSAMDLNNYHDFDNADFDYEDFDESPDMQGATDGQSGQSAGPDSMASSEQAKQI